MSKRLRYEQFRTISAAEQALLEASDAEEKAKRQAESDELTDISMRIGQRYIDYTLRDTERRVVDPVTGGEKNQKAEQYSLIPVEALAEVARVYAMGAEKYSRNNWRLGYDWHLSYDALQRHLNLFWSGEDDDPESGQAHLAHAIFHCMTLIVYLQQGLGTDDRQ